jgi:hypothetical protein
VTKFGPPSGNRLIGEIAGRRRGTRISLSGAMLK